MRESPESKKDLSQTIGEHVAMIRRATDLPVAVGFGVSNAAQASQVASWRMRLSSAAPLFVESANFGRT